MRPNAIRTCAPVIFAAFFATASLAQSPRVEVEGIVSNWSRTVRTFRVMDDGRTYTIRTTANTMYLADNDRRLTRAQFWASSRNGQKVKVNGTRNNTTVTASRIELDN